MRKLENLTVLAAVLCLSGACFAETAQVAQEQAANVSFVVDQTIDARKISYDLTRTFLTEEQWDEQVKAIKRRFHDWEKDNDGADMGRYLNDRFLIVALGAVSGEAEKIKKGIIWLAFYKEFNQPPPGVVTTAMTRHRESLSALFTDFTWEKATKYIKNKEWRKDTARKTTEVPVVVVDKKGS